MYIINKDIPWVICKRCEQTFKLGQSCRCRGVKCEILKDGAVMIEEDGEHLAVIDTE